MSFVPTLPLLDSAFDLTTLSFVAALLLLSLLSLSFIFHLRFRSRASHPLQNFNCLWTVRLLLVSFICLWTLNELLRLPFFRRRYLYAFSPLTLSQQATLCKIHVLLSLGFFEPAFLVTILFLVNVSIKKRNPNDTWAIAVVLTTCLPVLFLQILLVCSSIVRAPLPQVFRESFVVFKDGFGDETVLCTYPLLSSLVFGAFGIAYLLFFVLSCWRVVSVVINKGLRVRIYVLVFTILISLSTQILFLGLSVLWRPRETSYSAAALVVFLSTLSCAVAGEGILVIKPIADALAVSGECYLLSSRSRCGRESDRETGGKGSTRRI